MKKFLFFSLLSALALTSNSSFSSDNTNKVRGNKNIVSKSYQLDNFNSIDYNLIIQAFPLNKSKVKLHLKQGEEEKLTIKTDENIIDLLNINVVDSLLTIHLADNYRITNLKKLHVFVEFRDIDLLNIDGTATVVFDHIKTDKLKVNTKGIVRLRCPALNIEKLHVKTAGRSRAILCGKTKSVRLELLGVGRIDARNLLYEKFSTSEPGVGRILVD